jgi:hypothetical protein
VSGFLSRISTPPSPLQSSTVAKACCCCRGFGHLGSAPLRCHHVLGRLPPSETFMRSRYTAIGASAAKCLMPAPAVVEGNPPLNWMRSPPAIDVFLFKRALQSLDEYLLRRHSAKSSSGGYRARCGSAALKRQPIGMQVIYSHQPLGAEALISRNISVRPQNSFREASSSRRSSRFDQAEVSHGHRWLTCFVFSEPGLLGRLASC